MARASFGQDARPQLEHSPFDGLLMAFRALAVWLGFLILAFLNGALREFALVSRLGVLRGHQVSSVLLAGAILVLTYLAIRWIRPRSARQALSIGLMWLALVLAFEFGFGRARGTPWDTLLADYNVAAGRLWLFVLLATVSAPYATAKLRHLF